MWQDERWVEHLRESERKGRASLGVSPWEGIDGHFTGQVDCSPETELLEKSLFLPQPLALSSLLKAHVPDIT